MAYGFRDLSPKMEETLQVMVKHRKLVRYDGGLWSWEGCEIKHYVDFDCPIWHCNIQTLRALHRRGAITLDEDKKVATINQDFSEV